MKVKRNYLINKKYFSNLKRKKIQTYPINILNDDLSVFYPQLINNLDK